MSHPTEIVCRWVDAQPEGILIRGQNLAHLVKRNQASHQLARLAKHGRLLRMARGVYVAVTASRFGPVPLPVDKVVQSLATIAGRTDDRHVHDVTLLEGVALARPCPESAPALGERAKKSQSIRVRILGIGGGMVPRTKRLLKVRDTGVPASCEVLRVPAKSGD